MTTLGGFAGFAIILTAIGVSGRVVLVTQGTPELHPHGAGARRAGILS
jgi:hypothetical protein